MNDTVHQHDSGHGCQGKLESKNDQNGVIQPLLTDLYQITMAYAYWKSGKQNDSAVFDLFFRKNPFHGEFTLFAGLEECLKFLRDFHYSAHDIEYIRQVLPPDTDAEFFTYLQGLDSTNVTVYAVDEGTVVFPKVPLLRIEGPLPVVQLLETTLLNLVNYASLVATNAARFRLAAGPDKILLEFGLRRAQGPDGGLSASRYCYIGGFDGTSNVLAGKLFGIPVKGTHAHAFVNSYNALDECRNKTLKSPDGTKEADLCSTSKQWRDKLVPLIGFLASEASEGELAAFVAYAVAFPSSLMCLIDTYDVVKSGLPNFCAVAMALNDLGYRAQGIRLDSGDLAYLSTIVRRAFRKIADEYNLPWFANLTIVASNDINEDTIHSLKEQDPEFNAPPGIGGTKKYRPPVGDFFLTLSRGFTADQPQYQPQYRPQDQPQLHASPQEPHSGSTTVSTAGSASENQGHSIDSFGIGTHLVTCQKQPALGCVFKLAEVNGVARIKLSEDIEKITMPGRKNAYRLYGTDGNALVDLLQQPNEPELVTGQRVLCRHPFVESKRAYVIPAKVESLYKCHFKDGKICEPLPSILELRSRAQDSLKRIRMDHKRALNPTPYKVSVSDNLYTYIHKLWLQNAPIGELS